MESGLTPASASPLGTDIEGRYTDAHTLYRQPHAPEATTMDPQSESTEAVLIT